MVACSSVLISLTSLYKYYGTVLVTCDSMWDLLIFRATVTPNFKFYFMQSNDLKYQAHNPKNEEKQLLFK